METVRTAVFGPINFKSKQSDVSRVPCHKNKHINNDILNIHYNTQGRKLYL